MMIKACVTSCRTLQREGQCCCHQKGEVGVVPSICLRLSH
jgi:hypothetical protein